MRPNTLRTLRRYHHYLGLFFAPMILLFSVSGALQTFRLQEARGYGGTPPNWIVWIASVHKDQGPPRPPRAEQPKPTGEAAKPRGEAERAGRKRPSPLPLKIFVVLLSIALCASTITGVRDCTVDPLDATGLDRNARRGNDRPARPAMDLIARR